MTEKGWLGPYAPAGRHADKVTIDHIIDLRRKIADLEKAVIRLEKHRDNALDMVVKLQRQINEMQK